MANMQNTSETSSRSTSTRGFASMDPGRQREIARQGGRAAHEKGTAHEFTSEEARQAGKKGGEKISQNRAYMAEIGRRGGEARSRARDLAKAQEVPPAILSADVPANAIPQ